MNQTAEEKPALKYDHLLISSRGMFELHDGKIIVFAPAAEIHRATLRFGRPDHRPLVSLVIGVALSLVGLGGVIGLISGLRGLRYKLGMIVVGAIGGSIIFDTLKQRYFLEVEKSTGPAPDHCRLVFSRRAQLKEIQAVCAQARLIYKYQIDSDPPPGEAPVHPPR